MAIAAKTFNIHILQGKTWGATPQGREGDAKSALGGLFGLLHHRLFHHVVHHVMLHHVMFDHHVMIVMMMVVMHHRLGGHRGGGGVIGKSERRGEQERRA
jgi:hypothetical protein